MARYMRQYGQSDLRPPTVVGAGIAWHGPGVYLAYPGFVQDRERRRKAESVLRPPRVVTPAPTQIFFGPKVYLEPQIQERTRGRITRRSPDYELKPPAVIGAGIAWHGPGVYLAYPGFVQDRESRRKAKSTLRPPRVVTPAAVGPVETVVQTTLAPSHRRSRRTRPTYVYPIVVNAPTEAWGYIGIQLVQRPRPKTRSFLRPAVLLVAAQTYYGPSVHYVRGRRPVAKSRLRPPAILASSGPSQYVLAYSRRGRPRSFLRPPTDTVGLEDQGRVRTHLAYSRRGRTISELRPAIVVFLAVEIYGPEVHLTRIKTPPTVAFLRPPTDVVDQQDLGLVHIHLAYSRRGEPLSRLSPPAVVSPVLFFGPATELAPSFRGIPKSRLRPAAVVSQPPAYQQVIPPILTYSRRGRPVFFLNPPTVVFPFFARPTVISLAPQTRGRPLSFLSPPAILRERGALLTTLAPQRRGKANPFLRPPVVVRLAVEIYGPETQLAYSRRGRPKSDLLPPVVVGRQPFRGLLVHLTYSRRGRGFFLKQPELQKVVFRGLQVHLAYSRRGKPRSFLRPPAIVRIPTAGTLRITLARIKHPPVLSILFPPTAVGAPEAFYGPQVTLVRITPPRVIHALRVTLVAFRRPRGDVCGFDVAGSFVCELQVPGSKVSGSDSSTHRVTGTSRADTKITGSDSAGGSVSGSDRKAT